MDIKDIFIELTSCTTPTGSETDIEEYLPSIYKNDPYGNYYIQVGYSNTMFTSHLDNKCDEKEDVIHQFIGNKIKTDGFTILGADDKSGVSIMINMIDNEIPGLYYFFIGEENGRIGSKRLKEYLLSNQDETFSNIDKVISFDRQGYNDIVTYQLGERGCSDQFADKISTELNKFDFEYQSTKDGSYSDSHSFIGIFPECVNISVGYFNEHFTNEYQDIEFLQKLSDTCCEIDWDDILIQ